MTCQPVAWCSVHLSRRPGNRWDVLIQSDDPYLPEALHEEVGPVPDVPAALRQVVRLLDDLIAAGPFTCRIAPSTAIGSPSTRREK